MVKKYITCGEAYPVFGLRDPHDYESESNRYILEMTDEEYEDYQRVEREYLNWQETLERATKYTRR